MKIGKATYIVIAVVVLLFASAMLFFRLHIPGEAHLLAAVKRAELQYGVDNLRVTTPLSLLSSNYVLTGHPEKAVEVYKRIVAIDINNSGLESRGVVSSKHQLAILLDMADEFDQADALYVDIHNLEQKIINKMDKSEINETGGKNIKNNMLYKPILHPWLKTRIANLKARHEKNELDQSDSDMLYRYQQRLKMLD